MSRIVAVLLVLLTYVPIGFTREIPATIEEFREKRSLDYLSEFSNRRRLTTFFPNEQSPFYGVQMNYVNVGKGNVTFLNRDLVRLDRMPIVFGRVYDSSKSSGDDFGPGWKLTVVESIQRDGSELRYTDANNSTHNLRFKGNTIV